MAFTVEELSVFNVHELRARAREVGVRAPTTKKQNELIEEILKIQAGELQPHLSNMGRPVKAGIRAEILKRATSLLKDSYSNIDIPNTSKYEDCKKVSIITEEDIIKCEGIVRKLDGKFYMQNYLAKSRYVIIPNDQINLNNIKEGDYIKGDAKVNDNIFSDLINIEKINFGNVNEIAPKELKIVNLKNEEDVYSYIHHDKKMNKIILEIECNRNLADEFLDSIVIKTNECEDVKVSFNTLLDCKKFIQNLCNNNIEFTLYINNTEYIYSILKIYYNYIKTDQDLNAGQYFKEILSIISNSERGSVVLFEKEKCKRSSYLDIIINKYCN